MDEPVNSVIDDDFLETLEIQDVGEDEGPTRQALLRRLDDVGQYDVLVTVMPSQHFRTFRAQLSEAAYVREKREEEDT